MKIQKGHCLEFQCQRCKDPIQFSIFALEENPELQCKNCLTPYVLNDEKLKRQLKKFDALCTQIHDSQEILSLASVGVDVGEKQVKIPFKILLTRLSSCLDLTIGEKPFLITFRYEPLTD